MKQGCDRAQARDREKVRKRIKEDREVDIERER